MIHTQPAKRQRVDSDEHKQKEDASENDGRARLSLIRCLPHGCEEPREIPDGNIRASVLAARECKVRWMGRPKHVLLTKRWKDDSVTDFAVEISKWLYEEHNCTVYVVAEETFPDFCIEISEHKICEYTQKIDFIVCLGGDGTVLHTASLFPGPMPPLIPVAFGSLGFLTHFAKDEAKSAITKVLNGTSVPVDLTIRMRLKVEIHRKGATSPEHCYLALNELLVERGPSPYMALLDTYVNDVHLTTVQADGIIIATPTGSTAYSLSAGGSITTPTVPAILFTPICPHSLSFRPVIFPDSSVLKLVVPDDSRATAWMTVDGGHQTELKVGDSVVVSMSEYPLSIINKDTISEDWVRAITTKLYWNQREKRQVATPSTAKSGKSSDAGDSGEGEAGKEEAAKDSNATTTDDDDCVLGASSVFM